MVGYGLFASLSLVSILALISRVLGFGREAAIAAVFGASSATDVLLVASLIPFTVASVAGEALSVALVPIYVQAHRRADNVAHRLASNVFFLSGIILIFLAILGALIAPWGAHLIAPGLSQSAAAEASRLMRWMMCVIVFVGLGGVLSGILQARLRFAPPAFVGVAYNMVMITFVISLGPHWGISAAVIGFIVGTLFYLLIQWPVLWRMGVRLSPFPERPWRYVVLDRDVRRLVWILLPILAVSILRNMNVVVERIFASSLAEGSISALNFAFTLVNLPNSLLFIPLATVLYPTFAQFVVDGRGDSFRRSIMDAVGLTFFLVVPLAVVTVVMAEPLVRLLFQRGAFDMHATGLTSLATVFYGFGLPAFALGEIFRRALFAMGKPWVAVRVTMIAVAVNIILNFLLVGLFAHGGIALAASVSAYLAVGMLFLALRRDAGLTGSYALVSVVLRVALAATAMGLVLRPAYGWASGIWPGQGLLVQIGSLTTASVLGGVTYLLITRMLRVPEFWILYHMVRRLLGMGAQASGT